MTYPATPVEIFNSKAAGEVVELPFTFRGDIGIGTTLVSSSFTCVVETGTDPNPNAMLTASGPGPNNVTVEVTIFGGVVGVIYRITCTAVDSGGATWQRSGLLAVTS